MDRPTARIRFHADLAGLAWAAGDDGVAVVPIDRARSAKDAVESCGVPHTEVDLLLVNGRSVGFDALVDAGDDLAVHPFAAGPAREAASRVRPPPRPPRFLLDVHLGRLAEVLRLVGFDTAYRNDAGDAELAAEAAASGRWLLSRDRGLLMRSTVTHGYLVRAHDPREQVVEVGRRFSLAEAVRPYTRCARCNGLLEPVDKAEIVERLEPGTRAEHDEFARCESCDQLYWRGSHTDALEAIIGAVRAAGGEVDVTSRSTTANAPRRSR